MLGFVAQPFGLPGCGDVVACDTSLPVGTAVTCGYAAVGFENVVQHRTLRVVDDTFYIDQTFWSDSGISEGDVLRYRDGKLQNLTADFPASEVWPRHVRVAAASDSVVLIALSQSTGSGNSSLYWAHDAPEPTFTALPHAAPLHLSQDQAQPIIDGLAVVYRGNGPLAGLNDAYLYNLESGIPFSDRLGITEDPLYDIIDDVRGDSDGIVVGALGGVHSYSDLVLMRPDSDQDGDGISDALDNCPTVFNPGQEDDDMFSEDFNVPFADPAALGLAVLDQDPAVDTYVWRGALRIVGRPADDEYGFDGVADEHFTHGMYHPGLALGLDLALKQPHGFFGPGGDGRVSAGLQGSDGSYVALEITHEETWRLVTYRAATGLLTVVREIPRFYSEADGVRVGVRFDRATGRTSAQIDGYPVGHVVFPLGTLKRPFVGHVDNEPGDGMVRVRIDDLTFGNSVGQACE